VCVCGGGGGLKIKGLVVLYKYILTKKAADKS
jgi:hypothetical protein